MAYNVLNKQDLELELQDAGNQLVVIDFYANWCGPCKIIDPQLQNLSLQYANMVKFLKINVDDCEDIAMTYNITSMPTFVFIKDQQIVNVLVGGNVEKLVKNIEKCVEGGQATLTGPNSAEPEEKVDLRDDENNLENDDDSDLDEEYLQDSTAFLDVLDD